MTTVSKLTIHKLFALVLILKWVPGSIRKSEFTTCVDSSSLDNNLSFILKLNRLPVGSLAFHLNDNNMNNVCSVTKMSKV